jgi:hypothetical protein
MFDLRSAIGLAETDAEETALEALLGASIDVTPDWKMNVGGGLGVLEGFGIPTARVIVGLRWEPSPNDPDHDGLRNPTVDEDEHKVLEQAPPEGQEGQPELAQAQADAVDDATREAAIRGGYDACPTLPEAMERFPVIGKSNAVRAQATQGTRTRRSDCHAAKTRRDRCRKHRDRGVTPLALRSTILSWKPCSHRRTCSAYD